jgi:hypothetical protein
MLPHSYQFPVAALIVLGGAVSCFAGYRLFRIVLGIYGFVLGAMLASSLMGVTNTTGMIVAALAGGIGGALLLVFAYFIGIALAGAGLGVFVVAPVVWGSVGKGGDPPAVVVIVLSILGAIGAMFLQRYVSIVATAFAGAWMVIVGGLAISAHRVTARAASAADVWILYPTTPAEQRWVPVAWIVLGLIGTGVQLGMTGRRRK